MVILGHFIDDDFVKGISPMQQVTNNDGGKRVRFFVLTAMYPYVIESKNFYAGFGSDESDWPDTWKHYAEAHKTACARIAQLIDEEQYLAEISLKGVSKAAGDAADNLNG